MDGETIKRPATPAGAFLRAGAGESTRVARALARPAPVPAEALTRVMDADEAGAKLYVSATHRLPAEFAEFAEIQDADEAGAQMVPVEIPLPKPRSLIPTDVLDAIAREESELLAEEAFAEAEAAADFYDDESIDLEGINEGFAEPIAQTEALAIFDCSPLLSQFPPSARAVLAQSAARRRLAEGQPVFREGQTADSFFVVERGDLQKLRASEGTSDAAAGVVGRGEAFGLLGLLTRRLRTSTVRAMCPAQVVEIGAAQLDAVARRFPEARQILAKFFKERLLENFVAHSPIFDGIDGMGRAALLACFEDRKVAPGEILLAPGEVQNGLALVTSGRIQISRREGQGRDRELASLGRGEFFGLVSAMAGLPTRARIVATEACTLTSLPQRTLNDLLNSYPALRSLPARLLQASSQVERNVFAGDATALG